MLNPLQRLMCFSRSDQSLQRKPPPERFAATLRRCATALAAADSAQLLRTMGRAVRVGNSLLQVVHAKIGRFGSRQPLGPRGLRTDGSSVPCGRADGESLGPEVGILVEGRAT